MSQSFILSHNPYHLIHNPNFLDHLDYRTIDPLNLNQWKFFVISTKIIDKELDDRKSISLKKLKSLKPVECNYPKLNQYIKRAISK